MKVVVLERRIYDVLVCPPSQPPSAPPNSLHLLPSSLCQHCSPADNQAWISSDITLKRWLSPRVWGRVSVWVRVCQMGVSVMCVFKTD